MHTWWLWIVAIVSALLAIYHGPRLILETYNYYMEKIFDYKVRDLLESSVSAELLTMHGPRRWAIPKSLQDISKGTNMSEKRALGCLKRLKRKKEVVPDGDNWKIVV